MLSMRKVTFSAIISLILLNLIGCQTVKENSDVTTSIQDTSVTDESTPVSEEIQRKDTPDSLPELNYNGQKVRIIYRGDDITSTIEMVGAESGDVVSDAVFRRNLKLEEKLNIKFDFIAGDANYETYMSNLKNVLLAGEDAYDIVDAIQWRALPQTLEGLYYNLADAPYIDFTQPWWNNNYMNEITVSENQRYMLSGDISVMSIRWTSATFFNKKLYKNNFGDSDELYKTVLDGKWTHELFAKYTKEAYRDLNSNGKVDEGDIIGACSTSTSQTDHLVYPAGLKFTTRDKDGYPSLITDQSRNVKVIETIYNLYFNTPGVLLDKTGSFQDKEFVKYFTDGNMLFYPNRLYTTENLRDMKDDYGIIPQPKLDEEQSDYISLVHDATTLFGVPITCKDINMPCAVIEAMAAENYRTVIPAYYEVALKVKYTRDDTSAKIIDMIHDSASTDFVYANNYCFASGGSLGTIARNLMGYQDSESINYMSKYDSLKNQVQDSINALIENSRHS